MEHKQDSNPLQKVLKEFDFSPDKNRFFQDGALWFLQPNGEKRRDEARCIKNVGPYKLYAKFFECAYSHTVYYIVDTTSRDVYISEMYPKFIKQSKEIIAALYVVAGLENPAPVNVLRRTPVEGEFNALP